MNKALSFRPLGRTDFPLLHKWFSQPHVEQWWHESPEPAQIEIKYGPRINGKEPTHVFIIEHESNPIGWIQWYRWSDYPGHAKELGASITSVGIDLALGDKEKIGKGLGWRSIDEFLNGVVFVDPLVTSAVVDPEEKNGRSIRAFERAGFEPLGTIVLKGETATRQVMRLIRTYR